MGGKFKLTGPFTNRQSKGGEYDDFDDDEKTKVETTVVLLRLFGDIGMRIRADRIEALSLV